MRKLRRACTWSLAIALIGIAATPSRAQIASWTMRALRAAAPRAGKIVEGVAIGAATQIIIGILTDGPNPVKAQGPASTILPDISAPPNRAQAMESRSSERSPQHASSFAAFEVHFTASGQMTDPASGYPRYVTWQHHGVLLFSGNQGFLRLLVSDNGVSVSQVVDQDASVTLRPNGSLIVNGRNPRVLSGLSGYEADSFDLNETSPGSYSGSVGLPGGGSAPISARFLGVGTLPNPT